MRSVSSVFDFFDVLFETFLGLDGGVKIVLDREFDSMFRSRFLGVVYVL